MRYILLTLLLAGCAHAPAHVPVASQTPTYAEGFAHGKRAERQALINSPAFSVTKNELAASRHDVSFLPRKGRMNWKTVTDSRQRNLDLLTLCRKRNDAKRAVIFRMIDAVRHEP